jgi:hypothetical protein
MYLVERGLLMCVYILTDRLFQGREEGKCPACRAEWVLGKNNKNRRRVAEPVVQEEEDQEMEERVEDDVGKVEDEESRVEEASQDEEEEIPINTPVGRKRRR